MKEKIFGILNKLGFSLTELGKFGYAFTYEGINFLYSYNENDADFLNLSIPGIYEKDNENLLQYYAICDYINSTRKYVKAYTLNNGIWLFYERELTGDDDLEELLRRMIHQLAASLFAAREIIQKIEGKETDDND